MQAAITAADRGHEVVLIGGGLIGCEVALHMAEFEKDITILELTDQLARDANVPSANHV